MDEQLATLWSRVRARWACLAGATATVRVDPAVRYQIVEGWGTALAWWGHVVGGWRDATRNAIADLVFSSTSGLGFNVVRYNVGGGDHPTHRHMRPGGDVPGFQPVPGVWDWSADAGQRWMLRAAQARGATIFEAFANSPPYRMTRSQCAAGAEDGGNNLRDEYVDAFAAYLAEVVAHFRNEWGLVFRTVEPLNEPSASNWKCFNSQEGCHVSRDQQNALIARLGAHLAARGLTGTTVAAADEYSIDDMVATASAYDRTTLSYLSQFNTHSYSGTRRADLRALAAAHGKRLWMSEWGAGAGPHDHNAMAPALRLAEQIRRDMTDLQPVAWVYWQAVEHEQQNNWGFIHADFTGAGDEYWLTKQYYAMGHYSRFIRPGFQILGVDDMNTLAAYDHASGTLVVVYANGTAQETSVRVDLSRFGRSTGSATVYRTSAAENLARLPDIPLAGNSLTAPAPAQSISTYVITALMG